LNLLLAGFANGRVTAIGPYNGIPQWERLLFAPHGKTDIQRMNDVAADAIIEGNTVYAVSYQGKLAALARDSGQVRWESTISSYTGLALDGDALYATDTQGVVWRLGTYSGVSAWQQPCLYGRLLSPPAVFQGNVLVGDEDGYLHLLSADSGQFIGRTKLCSAAIRAPIVVKGRYAYVLSTAGTLYKIQLCNLPARVKKR